VIYSSLIEFDDRAENDNNEGTDESNEDNGMIVGSLSLEFIAKIVHILSCVGEKKKKKYRLVLT
jgi:hypothetical protein